MEGSASNGVNGSRLPFFQPRNGAYRYRQPTHSNKQPSSFSQNAYRQPINNYYPPQPPPQNSGPTNDAFLPPMQNSTNDAFFPPMQNSSYLSQPNQNFCHTADAYPPQTSELAYLQPYMPTGGHNQQEGAVSSDCNQLPPPPHRVARIRSLLTQAPAYGRSSKRWAGCDRKMNRVRLEHKPYNRVCFLCKQRNH